jgi:protein SCO1/2
VNSRVLLAGVVAVLAFCGAVFAAYGFHREPDAEPAGAQFEGAIMPKGVRAPDFDLRDQDGRPISMRALRGKPVIVAFLYTTCRDTCPAQANQVRGALDDLGHDVPAIAVAVDPPRDTAESAKAFLSRTHTLGRIDFVLGSRRQLKPLWKGFAVQPQLPTVEHQSRITLVDRRGFQRIGFPGSEVTPERLAHDVRLLERQ